MNVISGLDTASAATSRPELPGASDHDIERAIEHADAMALRGLLYQLTGDEALIHVSTVMEVKQGSYGDTEFTRVKRPEDVAMIRARAARLLKDYRDAGAGEVDSGPPERLYKSLSLTAGYDLPDGERGIWMEQTGLDPWARGLEWRDKPAAERLENFAVAIIGTGLSGLAAAVQLKRAGVRFTAFEKNADVGGTWYENRYPGARVDTPSRSYTHTFGVSYPYPFAFSPQEENLRYMRWVADEHDIREHIEFNTEATRLAWDDGANMWRIEVFGPAGSRMVHANAVICCVGFLSRPKLPEIAGMDSFQGIACHTAQWPEGLDIAGKRVAVIGSGASGYQTTPVIAKTAAHTLLFQRTPSWCYDNEIYLSPLPAESLWLERNFPFYVNFARFHVVSMSGPDRSGSLNHIDRAFEDAHARSPANKTVRDNRVAFIRSKLANRPELAEKMIPVAPPMSSRPIMIDARDSIYDALLRDDVTLVSDPIERITPKGILARGVEHELDVIVYATGFRADDFLWPMEVTGRDGQRIEDLWANDGPRSYIGSMLPGFPNFFMSYGPNSNNFGGFQVVDLIEIEIRFALQCIAGLIERDLAWVDVSHDAYLRYNQVLDESERAMIYMDPRANNYYRNRHGRSSVNCPVDFRRMWNWLRDPRRDVPDRLDAGLKPYFGADLRVGRA